MSRLLSPELTKTAKKPSRPSRLTTRDSSPRDESQAENQAVRRGFSWLAAGNLVNAACAWGRVALLARMGNAEMIGQLTLAFAVCNPIDALADLGLSGSLVSDADGRYRVRDYIGLRALTCGLAMLVVIGTAWAGGYDSATARLVVLAGLVVVSESVCDLFQAILQRREEMRWGAISLMVRGVLGLAFFAVGIRLGGNLAWGLCGFSLAVVMTLLTIDIPRALACERQRSRHRAPTRSVGRCAVRHAALAASFFSEARGFWRTAHGVCLLLCRSLAPMLHLAWLSLPLGLATASQSLMNSIPRYWVSSCLGHEALGGFAVAGSLMVAMSLLVGTMSQAASPRLARYYTAGNSRGLLRLLRTLSFWLAAVMIGSLLVMAIAGPWIIGLLFGPAYRPYAGLALCLTLAAGLRNYSILFGRAIASMRQFRTSLLLRAAGIAVLVILLPGWIAWLGLMGAAWALTITWLITVLLSLAAVLQHV
jgi:O-antigen/teichoic acid export membrane protein